MTRGQTTTTTLLAVIAVLLGLNMLVRGSPPAVGQVKDAGQPVPVSMAVGHTYNTTSNDFTNIFAIYRMWSDGVVDVTRVATHTNCSQASSQCFPTEQIIPPSCPADINRDRDVGVGDMLDLFAMWGPCE